MAIEGLKIIGESINDSVPSTKKLFAANDIEGLENLAKLQDEKGAAYIDVNVGERDPLLHVLDEGDGDLGVDDVFGREAVQHRTCQSLKISGIPHEMGTE